MDKFSVIIPTIWKSEFFEEMLLRYSKSEHVGEIILIDNEPSASKEINLPKVIHIKEKENTFVNPAWNKGVSLSKYENITIANDDILFNVDEYYFYFSKLLESYDFKDIGFVGSHFFNYKLEKSEDTVHFKLYDNKVNISGWGCLFSFHKINWNPIPDGLKIWYGDNWIHLVCNKILDISGIKIQTKMSTSSDLDEMLVIKENDTLVWKKMLNIQ